MRTWRVQGRSTTTTLWMMRVMGLLQARHLDIINSGGATWSPLASAESHILCCVLILNLILTY
jgi:hypothetical protein